MADYTVQKIDEQTYAVDEGGVRFFLLIGREKALMIDSGMNLKNVKGICAELTDLPLELINTHADGDHIGANGEFDWCYLNPAEAANYYGGRAAGEIVPVWDGQVIDLGERPLKIVTVPGHTPGSIVILDIGRRMLFSGDTIQDGDIFMFGATREMHAYKLSLEKLLKMKDEFDLIYPAHHDLGLKTEIIEPLIEGAANVLNKTARHESVNIFGNAVTRWDVGVAGFLCAPEE